MAANAGSWKQVNGNEVILVAGATGNMGREVVWELAGRGTRVRAVSRNADGAEFPPGVETVRADLSNPKSLEGRMEGVAAMFLVCAFASVSGVPALLETAGRRVRRIVFLSSATVVDGVERQSSMIGQFHADIERAIERSFKEWTFVRPGMFATNYRAWWGPQIKAGDVVRWPFGDAKMTPIHERDMADVAVRALVEPGHAGAKYVLTGPEAITQRDMLKAIGEAIGRELRFEELSEKQALGPMSEVMPRQLAEMILGYFSGAVRASPPISKTVADVTGRAGRTFEQWAVDHARDFS
jgi:uncharacterized protein YbjT (DUF2867 family)